MSTGTGFSHSRMLVKSRREKERLLFVAAAGLAFSLLVVMVIVVNLQSDASAGTQIASNSINTGSLNGSVSLFVPESTIHSGQKLSDVTLKEVSWPRNQVPDGAILDRSEVKDYYAKLELQPGVPLRRDFFTKEKPQISILDVTPGNRAVTLDIDQTSGLEGLALPGMKVDIVLTYFEQGELTSKVIVQNARILAIGSDTTPASDRPGFEQKLNEMARTATVDVAAKDALKISTARQLGKLTLVMRAPDDNLVSPEVEVNANDVGSGLGKGRKGDKSTNCVRGRFRVNGQEYQLNCDGTKVIIQDQ